MSVTLNPALLPPGAVGTPPTQPPAAATPATGPSFAAVLDHASKDISGTPGLRFSKHALQRVQRRGIDVSPPTLARLADGVGRAAGKGSRESVVLIDGTAFVVSVPSRTVITAVGAAHMRDQVFTNIDSAVIA